MSWPKGLSRREFNKAKKAQKDESATIEERVIESESANAHERRLRLEARPTPPSKPAKKNWGADWDAQPVNAEESPDRFNIPRDMFPEGLDLQWWTWEVRGQPIKERAIIAERGAWRPVKHDSFDNWHTRVMGDRFPVDEGGNLRLEGSVLYARPMQYTERARAKQERDAREQIALKEQAFKGGEMNATGANHPSAIATNKISRTMERIEVPKE